MSSLTTLARPYAKAAFELAQDGNDLAGWDDMLTLAGAIASEESVAGLLESPHVGATRVVKLLADIGPIHPSIFRQNLGRRFGVVPSVHMAAPFRDRQNLKPD